MKKLMIRLMPCCFVFSVACCGGTLAEAMNEADYTKYRQEQDKKVEVLFKKK